MRDLFTGALSTCSRAAAGRATRSRRRTGGVTDDATTTRAELRRSTARGDDAAPLHEPEERRVAGVRRRGIAVCAEWMDSPARFIADMGLEAEPGARNRPHR